MKTINRIFCSLLLVGACSLGTSAQENQSYFLHTIEKGQSLYSIASMYNISQADIVKLNPGSDDKIYVGRTLRIPRTDAGLQKETFHTIAPGETLYRLTVKYNVSAKAICDANPGLSADNFRIGQVIRIPSATDAAAATADTQALSGMPAGNTAIQAPVQSRCRDMHKVKRKETVFSISREYGITEEELIAANPELRTGKLKKGTFLFIPYPKQSESTATSDILSQGKTPSNEELFSKNSVAPKRYQTIRTALILPFSSSRAGASEEQSRMVEFYEGFLMAADSLKRQGISLDIHTFDSKGKASEVSAILAQSKMKEMDIIFGPVNQEAIPLLADFADKHDIRLVIPFSPKVDQVFKNPHIYQINTPQSYLYSEVYEHFIRKFGRSNVVFVEDGSSDSEKAEFIKGMKNGLKEKGISYKQVRIGTEIDPTKVIAAMDTLQENIFIPTSGRSSALNKILPHLTMVRREHPNFNMHLFGYPEWQTYTQDFLANFYELDTYFYSSFYTNNLFPAAIQFTHAYRRWYSKDMANTFPKYGMLGFDIGYYFLKGLAQQGNKLEENLNRIQVTPIQTGFKFERVNNWGGFINRKVFFVHFTKDFELIKLDFE